MTDVSADTIQPGDIVRFGYGPNDRTSVMEVESVDEEYGRLSLRGGGSVPIRDVVDVITDD